MSDFDERAATWDDDPAKIERARVVAEAIEQAVDLDGSQHLFEYGAGTGLVTQALGDGVGSVTLADTSAGMRQVMLDKIAAGAITNGRVWDTDLETEAAPDERFDLVVTVLTLHHIHQIEPVLARFAQLLSGGGRLCIVDLDHEDGSFHQHSVDVHNGFEREALARDLASAGFSDIEFRDCHHIEREGVRYPMFLATCRSA